MTFFISTLLTGIDVLTFILFVRIILSWFPLRHTGGIIGFVFESTDPIFKPFQKLIPPVAGIDFSPIAIFFVLEFIKNLLLSIS